MVEREMPAGVKPSAVLLMDLSVAPDLQHLFSIAPPQECHPGHSLA
jgi:hypothetical protein